MQNSLIDFTRALRGVDIHLAPTEIADAVRAAQLVGLENKQQLKCALSIVIAANQQQRESFSDCFDAFFNVNSFSNNETNSSLHSSLTNKQVQNLVADDADSETKSTINSTEKPNEDNSQAALSPQSSLGKILLSQDNAGLAMGISRAAQAVGLGNIKVLTQKGLYGRKMMMDMGLEALEEEMFALEASSTKEDLALAQALRKARDSLRAEIRLYVEKQFALFASEGNKKLRSDVMQKVHFQHLHEFRDVQLLVKKMAEKLAIKHSRRKKVSRRGQLDIRNTLKRNIVHDGLLFEPQWKAKRIDKPKVMALCDVSGSVATVARFLLMFLYSLNEVLPNVRAYAFSGRLAEVSKLFDEHDLEKAVELTLQYYGMGSTDYGQALDDFAALALDAVDNKTTIIMLGDARNNFGESRSEVFRLISKRAKQIIWLNPEPRNRWNAGDAIMQKYLPACSLAEQCSSLYELNRAVDKILRSLK